MSNNTILEKLERKELNLFSLLINSYIFFTRNFLIILLIALIVNLPFCFLQEAIFPFAELGNPENLAPSFYFNGFVLLLTMPAQIAVIVHAENKLNSQNVGVFGLLRRGFSRWGSFFGTNWLVGWGIMFRLILLIVPAIIYGVRVSFTEQACALREIGGGTAIEYSKSLVQGRFWKIFIVFILLFINTIFVSSIIHEILNHLSILLPPNLPNQIFFLGVFSYFVDVLIRYFWSVFSTLLFINLEYCKK